MNIRSTLLLVLCCGLLPLSPATSLPALSAQEGEEQEWMLEGVFLAADAIGIEAGQLFSALAHGLSIAEVVRAHGGHPLDLFDVGIRFEESEILDQLLAGEIDPQQARTWREQAEEDVTWMLFSRDPFGLEDMVWLFDGAGEVFGMDMLELTDWLEDGESLSTIALHFEIDPMEVAEMAGAYLEAQIDTLLLLGEIDDAEAEEWQAWSLESLPELLQDRALLETLADEAWMDEIVEILADMLGHDPWELWEELDQGTDLVKLLESLDFDLDAAARSYEMSPEELEEMIMTLQHWLEEPMDEDFEEDAAEF